MTDHPAIAAYCARNCPAQKTILDLLDAVGDDLPTLGQSVALAALSALALHRNVLFDHVIGKAPAGAHRGQAIASALLFQPAKWMGPVEGWLPRMDHAFPGWIDDLLTPGEDGLCGWDVLLADVADVFRAADFGFVNLETPVAPASWLLVRRHIATAAAATMDV